MNTGAVGTRPEQPPGTAHPHREPTPSPTGSPQPLTPPGASAHGQRPAASQAAATQAHPGPACTMAHLSGRQRAQHTRHPTAPPRRHTPLPRLTPPPPCPPTPCAPTPTTPPRAESPGLRQCPARRTYRPRHTTDRQPSGTTPHQPGLRHGQQNRHLPVAQPLARTPVRTRHAPPPRRAPRSPRAREADPSRRPWRKATPEGQRNRRTMKPSRLHCQRNRSAGSPRWARKKCGAPRNGQQRQHQWGNLAGERTGRQCRLPTHRT